MLKGFVCIGHCVPWLRVMMDLFCDYYGMNFVGLFSMFVLLGALCVFI